MRTWVAALAVASSLLAQAPTARVEAVPTSVPFGTSFELLLALEGPDVAAWTPPRAEDFTPLRVFAIREEADGSRRRLRVAASAETSGSVTLRGLSWRRSGPDAESTVTTVTTPTLSIAVVSSLAPDSGMEPEPLPPRVAVVSTPLRWWWIVAAGLGCALYLRRRESSELRDLGGLQRAAYEGRADLRRVVADAMRIVRQRRGISLDAHPASVWTEMLRGRLPETLVEGLVRCGERRERIDYAGSASESTDRESATQLTDALVEWLRSERR